MSPRSARGSTGWARWRDPRLTKRGDKAWKSRCRSVDPRSLFTVALGVCVRRRLSEILASFAFQVRRLGLSDGVWGGGALLGGKIKLAKHLQSWWIWPEVNYCVFTGKLPAFEVRSQIRAKVKQRERLSSPPQHKTFKMSSKTLFFLTNVLCVLTKKKKKTVTDASLRHLPLYLLHLPRQREEGEMAAGSGEGERRGPEVCLGGRWLSVAVNRRAFWCRCLGAGLSVWWRSSYQRPPASTDRRRAGSTS